MKRFAAFALIFTCMLFAFGPGTAKADDMNVSVQGLWDFWSGWYVNGRLNTYNEKGNKQKSVTFGAEQLILTQISFKPSDYMQAVLLFEIGNITWGRGGEIGHGAGGQLDTDGVNLETMHAYLDWIAPGTPLYVRMGLQGLGLPMGNGWDNPVFSANAAGVAIFYEYGDSFDAALAWCRPFDQYRNGNDSKWKRSLSDAMDLGALTLTFGNLSSASVTPWAMLGRIGNASGYYDYLDGENLAYKGARKDHANAWWLGLSTEVNCIEPLSFSLDAMYGKVGTAEVAKGANFGTNGWFIAAALNYKMDWATPGIYGWYASGDNAHKAERGEFGRLPVVGSTNGFGATSFGFPGSAVLSAPAAVSQTGMGTWGIALQLAEMSFIEDLSHTLRFAYYGGTNSAGVVRNNEGIDGLYISAETHYLTRKDHALEVNFDHEYKLNDAFSAMVELGYIHLKLDEDTWQNHETRGAWKGQVLFRYAF